MVSKSSMTMQSWSRMMQLNEMFKIPGSRIRWNHNIGLRSKGIETLGFTGKPPAARLDCASHAMHCD